MAAVIAVTGAGGELGHAVVQCLSEADFQVLALQRSSHSTRPKGAAAVVTAGDLSNEGECRRAFDEIRRTSESLSGLVNLAGGFVWQKVLDGEASSWDRMYAMNVKTSLNSCREAVPLMLEGSAIVNVGSFAASKGGVGTGAYAASKSALARLTESLADELKPNIRVNAVLPSIIDTPANRRAMPESDFSKWVTPVEVASVIAFLLSRQASGVTGALVPVPGRI